MDADSAASVLFRFDSGHAHGFHTIADFAHGKDHLNLVGYDSTAAFAGSQVSGGDTIINLDGGATQILLKNFTTLKATDFV
jgi:hypothetical protein